ncbi:MAG: flavodoxin family protein, partial [Acidobacteriota bacterium]
MDTPPWFFRWVQRGPGHRLLKVNILHFCGIRPVKIHSVGPVRSSTPERRERWAEQVRSIAAR